MNSAGSQVHLQLAESESAFHTTRRHPMHTEVQKALPYYVVLNLGPGDNVSFMNPLTFHAELFVREYMHILLGGKKLHIFFYETLQVIYDPK